MHVTDPLVDVIRVAIRAVVGDDMPIQFITGHTHIRSFAQLDDNAASFEAGRFLDTIGFCSFPTTKGKGLQRAHTESKVPRFQYAFLEPNREQLASVLESLHKHADVADAYGDVDVSLDSPAGRRLSTRIYETQQQLGLDVIVGCSPSTYDLDVAMDTTLSPRLSSKSSLWGLYMLDIVPTMLFGSPAPAHTYIDNSDNGQESQLNKINDKTSKPIFVQGTGAFRYKLFEGIVALDDVIAVCPFNDTIYKITSDLTGQQLLQILNTTSQYPNQVQTTGDGPSKYSMLPYLAISTSDPIDLDEGGMTYDLMTSHFHVNDMVRRVELVLGHPIPDPSPIQNPNRPPGEFWTTTNLWQYYIEQEWPCGEETVNPGVSANDTTTIPRYDHRRPNVVQEERPVTVVFFIVLVVVGLYVYQKRKEHLERNGYIPIGDATASFRRSSSMVSLSHHSGSLENH